MSGTGPLVLCRDASRTFGRGHTAIVAVHAATCEIPAGGRIAVVGSSGSGKSTLLHLMAGLDRPTSGAVSWPGLPERLGVPRAGVVFQGASLLPALTVVENVALPLVLRGDPDRASQARALEALTTLGLEDVARKLPEELSGGQAQRVAVARVLAARPRLIIADEPTGQLDQAAAHRVLSVLLTAADELGAGLVVSTHDQEIAGLLDIRWTMHEGDLTTESTLESRGRVAWQ